MKKNLTRLIFRVSVLIGILLPWGSVQAENTDTTEVTITSRLSLNYLCVADSVILTATLSINKGGFILALKNAGITFTASNGTTKYLLGRAKTDQEGNAVFKALMAGLPADKEGMVIYQAIFEGTEKYPEAEDQVSAMPAKIRLFFSIEDSLRTLAVSATRKNDKGEDVGIPDETVHIYVPRLFSLLKIGEIALDENGTGSMEFPKEIVGDPLGNLDVLARIEEHDLFGFVQGRNTINWGVPKHYYTAEVPSRELWTPVAPLWMIITLLIMLVGVWAHYAYAVYELVMIKRLSKKDPAV